MSKTTDQAGFPPPLKDHICRTVYSLNLTIQRIHKAVLDELGITYPQYLVLNLLWERNDQTVSQLANQLELEASTLTPLLKRLEAGGFVRRVRDREDERKVLISLTEQGLNLRSVAGCVGANLMERSGMTASEMKSLNAQLRALHNQLADTGT
jgi:MarR family transcriptional regulator, organic hydroperoxide resistance regulator